MAGVPGSLKILLHLGLNRRARQMRGQFRQLIVKMIDGRFKFVDLVDTFIQPRGCALDSFNGLNAASEVAATFAQLRIELRCSGLVPEFDLAECRLKHHAQTR